MTKPPTRPTRPTVPAVEADELCQAEVDAFVLRSRDELNASIRRSREEVESGVQAARTIDDIIADGVKRHTGG